VIVELSTDTHDLIRRAVLNWLARRDYSKQELQHKLSEKHFPADVIETVLRNLTEEGFINDKRFTENYINYRQNKGYGPLRIAKELQTRGISAGTIAEELKITDNVWFTKAQQVWQKRFKSHKPKDFKSRAKQMQFLQYRGFSREQIESVLKHLQIEQDSDNL